MPSGILRVYEHRKTGDVYIIKDPQIPLSDVDKVQEEVRELLDPKPLVEPEEVTNNEPSPPESEADEENTPDEESDEESSGTPGEPEPTDEEE